MADLRSLARKQVFEIKPYQPGKPIEEVQRELGFREVIKLASNENPLGPSELALQAMRDKLREICLYPDGGACEVRRALSKKLGVKETEVVLGFGSCDLIELVLKAFLNPGEEVVSSQYAFAYFKLATQVIGGENRIVRAKDFGHDLDAMADAITPKTKVVFIANPNNPTGTMNTTTEVERFMARAPDRTILVFDEAYYEFVDREDYPQTLSWVKAGRNVIILRTFSKIYGLAGMRIGYAIAREELVWALNQVRQVFNTTWIKTSATQRRRKA